MIWLRDGVTGLLRRKWLALLVFLVSELLVFGYWIQFSERCTGTANDMKLMLMCHGGDALFALEFLLLAPILALAWAAGSGGRRSALLGAGMIVYFFAVGFAGVWLMAHTQVVTWADLA